MITADWIKRRRELLDDATDAPWVTTADGSDTLSAGFNPDGHLCLYAGFGWDDDAALIADARTSLPLALDALEAVLAFATAEWDKITRTYIVQPDTAYAGYANAMDDVIRVIESALRGES